ncbi:hypothetical protein [Paraburkholderia sp. 2C]
MVKIRRAECLVLMVIVASAAAAVQVRERLAGPAVQRHAGFDEPLACGAAHDGLSSVRPVRCETAQGVQGKPEIDPPRAMSRRDTGRHARPQALWV